MKSPDPWQVKALSQLVSSADDVLLLASRGAGKTEVVAKAAWLEACLFGGYALVVSGSDRQAKRVIRYVDRAKLEHPLVPVLKDNLGELELANGGRVLAVPCTSDTTVGEHGVTLLVIDEAAVVPDQVYARMTPTTATSAGRLVLLSTPRGKRGFFHREWVGEGRLGWKRHLVPWQLCPRIKPEHVERERLSHGDVWVRQEYLCEFLDADMSYFASELYQDIVNPELEMEAW